MTVIETKEKKVTVMSAKPSQVPNIIRLPPRPQKQPVNATQGSSYNDAFAMFLVGHSKSAEPKQSENQSPAEVSLKVVVQSNNERVDLMSQTPPATVLQQNQESWTDKVLKQAQSQQKKALTSTQRVTTERIQPYVSGQNPVYAVCSNVRPENAQQVFYTIATNPSPQQQVKANGNGNEQKQQQQPFY